MSEGKTRKFICYFDCNGFESITDVTAWEKQCLLDSIAGSKLKEAPVSLYYLMMRARFNTQRNPEVWTFTSNWDIEEETLWGVAEENPQSLVDLIRENGNRIYGDRPSSKEPRIK